MLTQDDFVAPNMSAERNLQRSSWKAEAIRRGDLKISGPFPITEETPLSEDEEREYAEKLQVDPHSPLPDVSSPTHPPLPPPTAPDVQNGVIHTADDKVDTLPEEQENVHQLEHKTSSSSRKETGEMQRQSAPQAPAFNTPSPFPSLPESSTGTTPKKKRRSGLRNVFRKIFGRKGRESPQEVSLSRHGHHRSEPIGIHESPKMTREDISAPRISAIQVRELEPINPLGQHLPFPMNVNAPQEVSPPHEYLTFEIPPEELIRRRATLPSVLNNAEAPNDEQRDGGSMSSPQIGIALSSPPRTAQSVQSKRRSRSAGALRDLARGRPSIERRRSAEIRYWRTSYQSGSIYSATTPRPETARTVETVQTIDTDTHDAAANQEPQSIAESISSDAPGVRAHDQDISQIPLEVDAFNFGNLKSGFSDDEPDDEGLGITSTSEKRLSIEERVKHLEDNMRTLETSVRTISRRNNRHTIILENAPKGRQSRDRSSSTTSNRQGSHSSKSSRRTISVRQEGPNPPSPTLAAVSAIDTAQPPNDRRQTVIALETDTNPATAATQQPDLASQLSILTTALKHERKARKDLESHISLLQREVSDLHTLVQKLISRSPSYPTPSPDAIITSNEDRERQATPRATYRNPGLGLDPGYDGSDTLGGLRNTRRRFSRTSDSEQGADFATASIGSSREDITTPDAWATPKEESSFAGSGFFEVRRGEGV